jgi:hypothetical protein
MKIAFSGLADENYWEYIAKYCVESWKKLPGDKFIVHDSNKIKIKGIDVVQWDSIVNNNAKFLTLSTNKKQLNFWRKMQSQVWAIQNLTEYDFVFLLDTDVEILDFDQEYFDNVIKNLIESNLVWATGESQLRKEDACHIIINMKHPQLSEFVETYEDIWNSGKIFELARAYDGYVVEYMFTKFPSYKIKNRDYGKGLHVYDLGTVHWGSKEPKALRAAWKGDGKSLVEKRLSEIVIKKYKGE